MSSASAYVFFDIGGTLLDVDATPSLRPGAIAVLARLAADGHVLACISNVSKRQDSRAVFPELFRHFSASFMSHETGFAKPDLMAFTNAQRALRAPTRRCVMVGDSVQQDILPALTLGWSAVLIGSASLPTNHRCCCAADALCDLVERIEYAVRHQG